MMLIQALIATLFRSLGKILNMAFSWATVMLFGKVPDNKQTLLSVMGLGAVLWLVTLVGLIFPRVGAFLLAMVTLPSWVDDNIIRLVMLGLAILLPLGVGTAALFALDNRKRPHHWPGRVRLILSGYPYSLGLAVTIVLMVIVAPIMKMHDLVRRWQSAHVPLLVESKDYMDVLADIERLLREGGYETHREKASLLLRVPTKIFSLFAPSQADAFVADQLTVLKSPKAEVMLHPSDLVIRGREHDVSHIRALLFENLTFTKAYQTWTEDANHIEDKLQEIWKDVQNADSSHTAECLRQLNDVGDELRKKDFTFDEWEALFREKCVVERRLLYLMAGLSEPADASFPGRNGRHGQLAR